MNYNQLLSEQRLRPSGVTGRTLEEEADADRGRVLFCAPFRRLQNKAQVFSLETNAAVRSRLTHSLEVSSIGRLVSQQAIKEIGRQGKLGDIGLEGKERAFITFVETACLLHDIGNPPFGHFGEIAIADWFHLNRDEIFETKNLAGRIKTLWFSHFDDFEQFDGNPQGFRVITRLQPPTTNDLSGLNLTATTLASIIKYPNTAGTSSSSGTQRKKGSYFTSESDVIQSVYNILGMGLGQRHPLVYLMEAADDIAYCISDIEDGIEKRMISIKDLEQTLSNDLSTILSDSDNEIVRLKKLLETIRLIDFSDGNHLLSTTLNRDTLTPIADLRSIIIRLLSKSAGISFANLQNEILNGTPVVLFSDDKEKYLLDSLKNFASKYLYNSPIVRNREIIAYKVLHGILDAYMDIIKCDLDRFNAIRANHNADDNGRKITIESSLVRRIPKKHFEIYKASTDSLTNPVYSSASPKEKSLLERIYRIHLIIDFISGMTDEYALETFKLIFGESGR